MAFFLLPSFREKINPVVEFISKVWCPEWFKAHKDKINFSQLAANVEEPSVKKLLLKNHTETPLLLHVPLTNEVSEWALGRLTSVQQPKKLPSELCNSHLTNEIELQMKEKLSIFENKFL